MATLRRIVERFWPDCRATFRRGDDDYHGLHWLPGNPRPRPTEDDVRGLSTACDLEELHDRRSAEVTRPLLDRQGLDMLAEIHDAVLALREAVPRHLLPERADSSLEAVARRREELRSHLVRLRGPAAGR